MNIHERMDQWIRKDGIVLFTQSGLPQSSVVIDFGCGCGEYAASVGLYLNGSGTVYAVDSNSGVLKYTKEKIERYHLNNVIAIKTDGSLPLDFNQQSVDMLLLIDVIHTVESDKTKFPIRYALYEEARRLLKPDGVLAIAPFELSHFRDKNCKKIKFSIEKLITELDEYGFRLLQTLDGAVHFEKYHSPYQWKIHNNNLQFEDLETGPILTFVQR